jgi:hypothetical protein
VAGQRPEGVHFEAPLKVLEAACGLIGLLGRSPSRRQFVRDHGEQPRVAGERYAANQGIALSTNRKNRVLRVPDLNLPVTVFLGDESRTDGGFWRTTRTRCPELGCPPVGKQRFRNSGFRDVALPRYHAQPTILKIGFRGENSP